MSVEVRFFFRVRAMTKDRNRMHGCGREYYAFTLSKWRRIHDRLIMTYVQAEERIQAATNLLRIRENGASTRCPTLVDVALWCQNNSLKGEEVFS